MNWFTKKNLTNTQLENVVELVNTWGGCEHVESDPALTHMVVYENYSFGKEGYCYCKECYEMVLEKEDSEEHVCVDCKGKFKAKDMIAWKWYDFYAPQGDTPSWVCKCCQTKEKHLQRVARNRQDRIDELGY